MSEAIRGFLRVFTGEPELRFIGYTGSRRYPRLDLVRDLVRRQAATGRPIVIVSGADPASQPRSSWGVDEHAIDQARACGLSDLVLEPDWEAFGKAAGPLRNSALVAQASDVVGWWDGQSRGTADTILKAWLAGKLRSVYGPRGQRLAIDDAAALADGVLSRSGSAAAAV